MDKKQYFKDLIALLEADGMAGTPEVVQQENIADTGSDVMPEETMSVEGEGIPEEEIMDDELPTSMEEEIPTSGANMENVMKSQKTLKLYELYSDLLNYTILFLDSLGNIDTNLLELETFKLVRKYIDSTKELSDKINNYMINIFSEEEYEKLVYVYILFRTELVTCIKGIRDILKLNNPDEKVTIDDKSN